MLTYFDMQTRARHIEIRAYHRPTDLDELDEHELHRLELEQAREALEKMFDLSDLNPFIAFAG